MKINPQNPQHVAILVLSTLTTFVALCTHWMTKRSQKNSKTIILYGHKLNGNLRAFYYYLYQKKGYRVYFLSMDKKYLNKLKREEGVRHNFLYALNLKDMVRVGQADAFITSHGLHFFWPLNRFSSIKFFDSWHGIPYKGFSAGHMKFLHGYTQTWVSSGSLKSIYIDKFGFKESQVKVTGYGRVDQFVNASLSKKAIIEKYNIPKMKKYILIAPTWAQDEKGRNILPFGTSEKDFFGKLDKIANKHDALIIFRTHLNSSENMDVEELKNTLFMPYARYEITEDFLFIADVLVTDWSSIAFDYLPLDRPTLFLDVQPPFSMGFSLGPEYRFGRVVAKYDDLTKWVDVYLKHPHIYDKQYKSKIEKAKKVAYGNTLDGKSCLRYEKELHAILEKD